MSPMNMDRALDLAASDDYEAQRGWAAQWMGTSDDPRALPALTSMLSDREPFYDVYVEVLVALYRQGEDGIDAALRGGASSASANHRSWFDVGLTEWMIEGADLTSVLRRYDDTDLGSFVAELRERLWLPAPTPSAVVPTAGAGQLVPDRDPGLDSLIARSRSSTFRVRQRALPEIARLAPDHPQAFHRLVQMMLERDLSIMAPAVDHLLHLGAPGLSVVLKSIHHCFEESFHERMWMPIQDQVPDDLRTALETQLDHPDPDVRAGAREVIPLVQRLFRPRALTEE